MKSLRYIILFLPLMLTACGYSFGESSHSVIDEQYRLIAIGEVTNPTTLTWLEPRLRKLLKDELTNRGTIRWTDNKQKADAILNFRIIKYYRPSAVEGIGDTTLRSSANFEFEATIRSATDSHVIWQSGSLSQDWPFYSGQEDEADKEVTRVGIRRLADKMSQNY